MGSRSSAQQKPSASPPAGAPPGRRLAVGGLTTVATIGALVVIGLGPLRDFVEMLMTPRLARCVSAALVKSQHMERKAALKFARAVANTSAPLLITSTGKRDTENQVISDPNQAAIIEACARESGAPMPRAIYRGQVAARDPQGRPLPGVQVALARDHDQMCITKANEGVCVINLTDAFVNGQPEKLIAGRIGYRELRLDVSRAAFSEQPTFVLERSALPLELVVTRHKKVTERARVSVAPEGTVVWSRTCEETGHDSECDREFTNGEGIATFYYPADKPFTRLSVAVTIDGEPRTQVLEGPPRHQYEIRWDALASTKPPRRCEIDGGAKPSPWKHGCANPTKRSGPELTQRYRQSFPEELGDCAEVVEYVCP